MKTASSALIIAAGILLLWVVVAGKTQNISAAWNTLAQNPSSGTSGSTTATAASGSTTSGSTISTATNPFSIPSLSQTNEWNAELSAVPGIPSTTLETANIFGTSSPDLISLGNGVSI